jgi:hypothetical protein
LSHRIAHDKRQGAKSRDGREQEPFRKSIPAPEGGVPYIGHGRYNPDITPDTIPIHYRYNTDTLPIQYRYNTDTLPIHYRYNTDTLPIQYRYTTDTIPGTIPGTIPIHYETKKHKTDDAWLINERYTYKAHTALCLTPKRHGDVSPGAGVGAHGICISHMANGVLSREQLPLGSGRPLARGGCGARNRCPRCVKPVENGRGTRTRCRRRKKHSKWARRVQTCPRRGQHVGGVT